MRNSIVQCVIYLYILHNLSVALDNGLARTPPMGWLSWERFGCNTDCETDPDNCIGERLVRLTADRLAGDGWRDAGYRYLTLDDCWPASQRDSQGRLQVDSMRFPSGMKALADYVHSRGLLLGLYLDVGRHTCAGFPGSLEHYEQDASTLAAWGVDMVKFDGCNTDEAGYDYGYPAMQRALNATGRTMLYSCEWPVYSRSIGVKPNYSLIADTCNTFRVYGDIYDSLQSVLTIIGWYEDDQGNFSAVAGPGSYTDADMLVVGNYGLSTEASRLQFGMWALLSSQMFLSVDLRTIRPEHRSLLQNPRVIAISQDTLGKPARRIMKFDNGLLQVWTRPVTPTGSLAVGILNRHVGGYPRLVNLTLSSLELADPGGYNLTDVFSGESLGLFKPTTPVISRVPPSGLKLYRATPYSALRWKVHTSGHYENKSTSQRTIEEIRRRKPIAPRKV